MSRKEFHEKMSESGFILIKPNELRKKYTEFVMFNKARALLPSKRSHKTIKEEIKANRSLQNKSIEEAVIVQESKTRE
jgi:hypothetical protein